MKIIKINDNLKINIENLYSLEKTSNQNEINIWEESYKELINEYAKDPPMLIIGEEDFYKPEYGENIDNEKLSKYTNALNKHIVEIIGEKPIYTETYLIILNTGLKVNVDESIYNKINKCLQQYEIDLDNIK